jgi:hypothetical protein
MSLPTQTFASEFMPYCYTVGPLLLVGLGSFGRQKIDQFIGYGRAATLGRDQVQITKAGGISGHLDDMEGAPGLQDRVFCDELNVERAVDADGLCRILLL